MVERDEWPWKSNLGKGPLEARVVGVTPRSIRMQRRNIGGVRIWEYNLKRPDGWSFQSTELYEWRREAASKESRRG